MSGWRRSPRRTAWRTVAGSLFAVVIVTSVALLPHAPAAFPAAPAAFRAAPAVLAAGRQTREAGEWRSVREQLEALGERERETLAGLLEATTLLRRQEEEVSRLRSLVAEARGRVEEAARQAASAQERYLGARERAGRALRALQQAGPGSYLDLLLAADSWASLLERWRLVTDLAQGTLKLLREVAAGRDAWRGRLAVLEQERQELEARLEEAAAREESLRQAVAAREELLASLGTRRSYFERRLRELEDLLAGDARPLLEELAARMARADLAGAAGAGPVSLRPGEGGWQVSVGEAVLEAALAGERGDAFEVSVGEGRLAIAAPGGDPVVEGRLLPARGGTAAALEVEAVQVAGVRLGREATRSLLEGLDLVIDLGPLLPPGMVVLGITAVPGWVEVTVGAGPARHAP